MKLHKMIEVYLKYDNMHTNLIINAFICINNHVNSCIKCMLLLCPWIAITEQSNSTWLNLEQLVHGDPSWSETGISPSEPLWMLSWSNKRLWIFTILWILSRSIPVSADFASINCPFGIAPLPNGFTALWWLFSVTVSISSMASSLYLLMKVPPLDASKRYLSCRPNP